MGDMADEFLDNILDGGYSDEDAEYATCNRCGETPLHWFWLGHRWQLQEPSGEPHICRRDPTKMFDPVDN